MFDLTREEKIRCNLNQEDKETKYEGYEFISIILSLVQDVTRINRLDGVLSPVIFVSHRYNKD